MSILETLVSALIIEWSVISTTIVSIILDILLAFLTPKKEEYFIKVEIHQLQ